MTDDEKEDFGLLLLMQQSNREDRISRDEIMDILNDY